MISSPGYPRKAARVLARYLASLSDEELKQRQVSVNHAIKTMGISFTVYSEAGNIDREWPFDVIPRIITNKEWEVTSKGLTQRLHALNCFIHDVYNDGKILKDKVVPRELIADSGNFRSQCQGMKPKHNVWAHVCGTDLVRDADGKFYVLEDNLRVPSGVSYMLENRTVTKRVFPELFENYDIQPIAEYPGQLFETLASIAPCKKDNPGIVVLTPGIYNSAYFEHSFLAQQMGAELVQGSDLVVEDDHVYMKTINGLALVDVIYRRIDDLFIDPSVFNKDSTLGVAGLLKAWLKGNVGLANAPGAGVADDKVIYTYVPAMIKYYLGEDAILPNVPSFLCIDPAQREHVLKNLDKLVVKPKDQGQFAQLYGAAARGVVHRANHDQRYGRAAPCRLATLRTAGQEHVCNPWRPHPRGAGERFVYRQFIAGWRQQRHVDRQRGRQLTCCRVLPSACTGWGVTWSGWKTPHV